MCLNTTFKSKCVYEKLVCVSVTHLRVTMCDKQKYSVFPNGTQDSGVPNT